MADVDQDAPGWLRPGRLEAFSDGVFAIAITLLVLEISVPEDSDDDLWGAVVDQWPSYLAYLTSFSTIGVLWFGHWVITQYLESANSMLVRINLLLLMLVSFIPFPTRLLAEYSGNDDPARVAATIYGVTLLASVLVLASLWRYALMANLIRGEVADEERALLTARLTPGLAGYAAVIAVGVFLPIVAILGYLALAILIIAPFGAFRRLRSSTGA